MKFAEEKYPCYTNTAENISDSFAIKFCLSKNSILRRNFQNARNSGEKLSLRYASVPDALNTLDDRKETAPALSTFMLRRTQALSDVGDEPEIVQIKSKLDYHLVGADYAFNASEYVYSGSLRDGFFLQQGITLDREDRLLLVKGKQKDFIKSYWQKVQGTKKFYIARIDFGEYGDLRFDRLTINDKGHLIAKKKDKDDYYKIRLGTDGTATTLDGDTGCDTAFSITVSLVKLPQQSWMPEDLRFNIHEQATVELAFKQGTLYLVTSTGPGEGQEPEKHETKLSLPLSRSAKILSVAKILNMAKLTVEHNGLINIYYVNPKHVDTVNARIRHLSQKPPQNFYSGSGTDSYERVYSGQPFAGRRWDKFSSRWIPLLSKTIDNYRVNIQRARTFQYLGDRRRAVIAAVQAVDPCIQILARPIARKLKPTQRTEAPQTPPHELTGEFGEISRFVNNDRMNQLYASASAYLNLKPQIIAKIKHTLSLLEENDSISLNKSFDASFFIGLAVAGPPFMPGFFAGFMARFSRGKALTLTKNAQGNIRFNYNKINYKTFISIFGTGQGLEDNCKLIRYNNIDFATFLPFEANAILVTNKDTEINVSVDVPWQYMDVMLDALFNPGNAGEDIGILTRQAVKKSGASMGATLLLEAKSELRAQVGFMANPETFLVLPRTGSGIGGSVNFFDINKQTDEVVTYSSTTPDHNRQVNLQQNYFSLSLYCYQESKIMPIAMVSTPNNTLLCFPLPLTEELKQTLPATRNVLARYFRLDGTTLKIESDPLVSLQTGEVAKGGQQETEPAFNLIANELKYVISGFSKMLPQPVGEKIEALSKDIKNAVDRFHGYQTVKQGKQISTFILSQGDYQRNLRLLKQQKNAKIALFPQPVKPQRRGLKQSLRFWTRNTTLGEYYKKKSIATSGADRGQRYHTVDFIRAVENYSGRSSRDSMGKRSEVLAIATYKIQKQVIRQIYDEFIAMLNMIMLALAAGKNYDAAIKRLEYLSTICSLKYAGTSPVFQLDHIRLVRQNTLASHISTVPCTILNVASKNEITYTASLGTLRFMYRNKEVFPYDLTSSLKIMPDLFF
ncbi:hypothetical protein [Acerihabitans sp.]|uniref:hypothetical protein n=1 Tax=Acerihabitans sp. TaxID=2811394 RepID=UPI002ED8785C